MFGRPTTVKVEGMTCGNCAAHVEKAVQGVPGAKGVKVDLEAGTVSYKGDPSDAAVAAAIEDAGYAVAA